MQHSMTARCVCGSVELQAVGDAITSVVCYCDDCHEGARQIKALPNAGPVRDPDGGSAFVIYRKDRVTCSKGARLLRAYKIKDQSATNRLVATCCNSAMLLNFDDRRHWVDLYRARLQGNIPPLQMRIATKFKAEKVEIPSDVPSYAAFPLRLFRMLIAARFAMLLRR